MTTLSKPPCNKCGYNGAGYYQPSMHPCAAQPKAPPAPVVGEHARFMSQMYEAVKSGRARDIDTNFRMVNRILPQNFYCHHGKDSAEISGSYRKIHLSDVVESGRALTDEYYRLETVAAQMREALGDIIGICQGDLETHFGQKYGGKIRKAAKAYDKLMEGK